MSSFSFPILSWKLIQECALQLGWSLPAAALQTGSTVPLKAEDLQPLWEKFVEQIKGLTKDQLKQLQFKGLDLLSFPELHDESIPAVGIDMEILDLIRAAGVTDVSITDLQFPEKQKIKRILSALINIFKYSEEKKEVFSALTAASIELAEKRVAVEQESDALEMELAAAQKEHQTNVAPFLAEAESVTEEKRQCLAGLVNRQKEERDKMKQAKEEANELKEKSEKRSKEIEAAQLENKLLKRQIVPDPEKLQQTLVHLQEKSQQNRQGILQQQIKVKEIKKNVEEASKKLEKLKKIAELQSKVKEELDSLNQLVSRIDDQQNKSLAMNKENQENMEEEKNIKKNLQEAESKFQQFLYEFEQNRTRALQSLDEVQKENQHLQQQKNQLTTKFQNLEQENQKIKNSIEISKKNHESTINNLKLKYEQLIEAVKGYHLQMTHIIQTN